MDYQINSASSSDNLDHHKTDLKQAIKYLPANFDFEVLCKLLKHLYNDEGKDMAIEWAHGAKVNVPSNFDAFWEQVSLTSYQRHAFDTYINKKLYSTAKNTGWTPKALRHGKQTKKPPKMKLIKKEESQIEQKQQLENDWLKAQERGLDDEQKSYIPPSIVNMQGACYFHPFMKKEKVPEDEDDYLRKLTKIVDCEVWVHEAIEYIIERQGRQTDEVQVKYRLELNNREGKQKFAEADHEDITTPARFSSFLVSKGFTRFKGKRDKFNMFHEFLINGQQYPTIKRLSSWGEFKPGKYLFENGLFDAIEGQYYPADDQLRIAYKDSHVICPSGSEQVTPPQLSLPTKDSQVFLKEAFLLWEDFNGSLNVRTTIGYAVATIFSRYIAGRYNGFPLLFNFGERGTGKSTSMDWFMALFGYQNGNRQSISKQNTIKSVIRRMTLPAYFPFFLDDYRNHETNSNAPNLVTPILNWFEHIGTGMAKKSTDYQTIDTPMKAAVVMTGNDKPTDPAVLSRMIILNYTNFLKKDQQRKVKFISDNTDRLSEFTYLVLKNYGAIKKDILQYIEANKNWLADQGFEGRTSLIWSVVLAGYQCLPHVLPGLTAWHSDFEGLRNEICQKIKKEASLQYQQAPLYEFFEGLDFFATVKQDPDNYQTNLLDHRHFRYRADETVEDHNGQVTYQGPVLAVHLPRVWNSLQGARAAITHEQSKATIESMLANSKYYLAKSQQVFLTTGRDNTKESNLRCYYLSGKALEKRGLLEGVIEKAQEYERNREARLSGKPSKPGKPPQGTAKR